jgi:ATP-binding cassette subfamily F protein uup
VQAVATEPTAAKPRLSFHERRALASLPQTISVLQGEVDDLLRRLADRDFYARDPAGFHRASEALVQKQSQLRAAEEQWLELEIRREAIERG